MRAAPDADLRHDAVELPVSVLAALIERAGVGEPHLVLRPAPVWRSREEETALSDATLDALSDAGLLRSHGQVDQHLLDVLPVLTTPVSEYYGWFTAGGLKRGVLAAAGAMDALLAVRTDDMVRLTPVTRDGLAEALLTELPDTPPGKGSSLTVTAAEIVDLCSPADVSERRVPSRIAEMMRTVNQPVLDGGELYVGHRDTLGRHTVRGPVRYGDTEQGRFLSCSLGTGDALRIVLTPASRAAFTDAFSKAQVRAA